MPGDPAAPAPSATAAPAEPARPWRVRAKFCWLVFQLGTASLVWNLLALPLQFVLPRRLGMRIGRAVISNVYHSFWRQATALGMMRVDTSALDVLRDEPGGIIVAGNHPTMYDAMLVVSRLQRGVCIMKAILLRNPFLGAGARLARYIRNDTGRGMVRDAVESLREGGQLVLFPEGTRTVRPPVNAFKPGITLISHLAGVPIQTVIIETTSPYLTKGWPLLKVPPVPIEVRVRLGERFEPMADHRAALRRLEAYFARELS